MPEMRNAVVNPVSSLLSNPANTATVKESRERSRLVHRLDPVARRTPLLATEDEVSTMRQSSDLMLRVASEEIDRLHSGLQAAQCAVLLAGPQAVVLDHRISPAHQKDFLRHGAWTGGDWSERVEGTNAVGTATAAKRAVMVRGEEHYSRRNGHFTCIGVPVHSPAGEFAGSLTVARPFAEVSLAAVLAMSFVRETVAAIEQRQFRVTFARQWVVLIRPAEQTHPVALFAVDRDRRIVGADHMARQLLELSGESIEEGVSFDTLFSGGLEAVGRAREEHSPQPVMDWNGDCWLALVSPPARLSKAWLGGSGNMDPTRPRWLHGQGAFIAHDKGQNGATLSPHVLTRVIGYIEDHLDEALPLEELSGVARLRRSHFSQAFRGATGMSPHSFVLERRIARAKRLLADNQFSVTDVALASGFASASHFATAFRAATGMTPRDYRASLS